MAFTRQSLHWDGRPRLPPTPPSLSGLPRRKMDIRKFQPLSVYGGAGGSGTRVSTSPNYGQGFGGNFQLNIIGKDVLLAGNEKTIMQNLNDRLASYMEKVRSLEKANSLIEKQINKWYEKNTMVVRHDYSSYFKTIEDLQKKIGAAQLENARFTMQIDNTRLAAVDFRLKYDSEHLLRQTVKGDINKLLRSYDDLTLIRSDLESQIESVNEELVFLKKNHEEDVDKLRKQVGSSVNVEVDAAPGTDLATIMENMRQQYEEMAEKYRQEAEERFEKQTEELNQKVAIDIEELQAQSREITNRRQIFQGLKVELQAQLNMKKPLQDTLAETEAHYRYQLTQIQEAVVNLEAQLRQLRADMEGLNNEYSLLLDIKTHLEMEIATYRRLLEGEDSGHFQVDVPAAELEKESSKVKKIKKIVEEVVDGKVVSSKIEETEENL